MPASLFSIPSPQQNMHDTRRIGLLWLVTLRWWAVIGQILTISIGSLLFHLTLPLPAISSVILLEIISNAVLSRRLHTQSPPAPPFLLPLTLYGDIALLTGLLYITGGTMNPFTFLYLVHITLGAILLSPIQAWGLTALTIISYGIMFLPTLLAPPAELVSPQIQQVCEISSMNMDLHLQGMWFAYAISAVLITFFASRIQQSLGEYHQTIAELRHDKLQRDKLSALATLAAGAAHELSTPLATIHLASGEMIHACENQIYDDSLLDDALLIRDQTKRCKNILFQMSADAGAIEAEKHTPTTTTLLIENARELLGDIPQKITINNMLPGRSLFVPSYATSWALKSLLANAADASSPAQEILLECTEDDEYIYFNVIDHGCGMTTEIAEQAPEPFFTTKPVGKGMGLGLFLAKSLTDQLEGSLAIRSRAGEGTTISMSFRKTLISHSAPDIKR